MVTPPLASARPKPGSCGPYAVLGPDLGGDRAGRLVAVRMRLHAGRGIVAEVAVDVDHAGRQVHARAVDHRRAGLAGHVGAGVDDAAVLEEHRALRDPPALAVEDVTLVTNVGTPA